MLILVRGQFVTVAGQLEMVIVSVVMYTLVEVYGVGVTTGIYEVGVTT